jgi:hypothetical protein
MKNHNVKEIERPSCSSTSIVYSSELFSFSKSTNICILSVKKGYSYLDTSFYFTPDAIVENDEDCWELLYRFRKSELTSIMIEVVKEQKRTAFEDGKREIQHQLKELLFGE